MLEGFHALKHALRFGAEIETAVASTLGSWSGSLPTWRRTWWGGSGRGRGGRRGGRSRGWCRRRRGPGSSRSPGASGADLGAVLADPREAPVVLLEQPRNMGNLGACVRVAAAADAAALLTIGENDPWHPDAVRGAAGLHYALPRGGGGRAGAAAGEGRPLLALDPEGEEIDPAAIPPRAVLAFGTERHGLSDELLAAADARIALPMRAGVSSLNLATSVAAVLYAVVLQRPPA